MSSVLTPSDERLVRRIERDPAEFATLYERHRSGIYAQCLRRLRSPADADDATQATFLKAFSALRRGTVPQRVGPWLSGIARNVCSDRLGARRELPGIETYHEPADDGPDLDAALLAEADGLIVRSALARLPFGQRSVLHLREVEELSYAEVSERLALPVGAVETLLFRARANLRDEIVAGRSPLDCEAAHHMAARVRTGDEVLIADRKALRNHRESCAGCSSLPVRRARTPRAALVVLGGLIFGAARKAVAVPAAQAAQALASAAEPAKLAVVAISVGGAAAGGAAVVPDSFRAKDSHVAQAATSARSKAAANPTVPAAAVAAPAIGPVLQAATGRETPARRNPAARGRGGGARTERAAGEPARRERAGDPNGGRSGDHGERGDGDRRGGDGSPGPGAGDQHEPHPQEQPQPQPQSQPQQDGGWRSGESGDGSGPGHGGGAGPSAGLWPLGQAPVPAH